ncbi:ankyrin repeat domain-containing protein [Tsukamurella sp. 8F]|uniref:ankyrin repeat domain-containing protein n=1 Tax=unclassified Tsukamurella TaxID=2633480 RepID=UPI0023B9E319|nr:MULTISPECIES: ankyrin repeat domain-containing protein [unclassified Tsukamurella]MDF0530620.1 ankyrin repeat domain-containing protein [Tsukamurella sp. 8J]MDF0587821.1 ankyrin repeat domain-containing protein [Tsukamurella sp. 8F]
MGWIGRRAAGAVSVALRACPAVGGSAPGRYYDDPRQVEVLTAAERGDLDGVRRLAAAGVDLGGVSNTHDSRRSELPLLLFAVEFTGPKAVTTMLRAGADPLQQSEGGYNAAAYAILREKPRSLRALLDFDPELVESPDRLGGNVLHTAVLHGNRQAIDLLLGRGVDVNTRATVSRETPLFGAATLRRIDICMTLLRAGADASLRDVHGGTFLHPLFVNDDGILTADFTRRRSRLVNELRRRGFPVETGR